MPATFGTGDATFQAAGGEPGIRRIVDAFYQIMSVNADFSQLRILHAEDLGESSDRLSLFLCGWMGGPRLYQEKYGAISIPGVHAHLPVTASLKDQWLNCMRLALEQNDVAPELQTYLIEQLSRPAQMILEMANRQFPETP